MVSHTARYPAWHGIPHGTVSRTAWYLQLKVAVMAELGFPALVECGTLTHVLARTPTLTLARTRSRLFFTAGAAGAEGRGYRGIVWARQAAV